MSNEERERILTMVAERKISAEEAGGLLEALEPEPRPEPRAPVADIGPGSRPGPQVPVTRRNLIIQISEGGKSKVNLRIPIGLARAAGRFIPRMAQERLDDFDIDLRELLEDLGQSLVQGPLIEIQDGDDRVLIAVE